MQALGGLAHAHGLGVVHRDLKPANLMITDAGTVKIMDFGIARVSGTEHLTSAGFMMGTPAYMAPEQVLGQDIDARSDLYAIGVVFFYLTTAKLPFKGDTPFEMAQSRIRDEPTPVRTVRAELPSGPSRFLDVALARAPEQRFQSAPVFRESLRRGMANLPHRNARGVEHPTGTHCHGGAEIDSHCDAAPYVGARCCAAATRCDSVAAAARDAPDCGLRPRP